jgi:hypothetical protein
MDFINQVNQPHPDTNLNKPLPLEEKPTPKPKVPPKSHSSWTPLGATRDYFYVQLNQDSLIDRYRP